MITPKTVVSRPSIASGNAKGVLAVVCALFALMLAAPTASAAKVNGKYKITKVSGSVTVGENETKIPKSAAKAYSTPGFNGFIIKRKRFDYDRDGLSQQLDELEKELGAKVTLEVTGPDDLSFKKKSGGFSGKLSSPVVVTFTIEYEGQSFSGEITSQISVKVTGKTMKMKIRQRGTILGQEFESDLKITAVRK